MTVTAENIREWFLYDPSTGVFTRRVRRGRNGAGSVLSGAIKHGYLRATLQGRSYAIHRLAFLWMTGMFPIGDVDHIDGNRANNKWSNLRDVDRSTNLQNIRSAKSHNKSTGLLGAYLIPKSGRYTSRIRSGGKNIYLGVFSTADEARSAYIAAKRQLHPGSFL